MLGQQACKRVWNGDMGFMAGGAASSVMSSSAHKNEADSAVTMLTSQCGGELIDLAHMSTVVAHAGLCHASAMC